jgi:hypothetical protein
VEESEFKSGSMARTVTVTEPLKTLSATDITQWPATFYIRYDGQEHGFINRRYGELERLIVIIGQVTWHFVV